MFPTLPTDERGFIRVDPDSRRVAGYERIFAVGDAADFPVKQAFLLCSRPTRLPSIWPPISSNAIRKSTFDPMNIYVMEQFDKATFAQVPMRQTGVDLDDQEHYKVGVSPSGAPARSSWEPIFPGVLATANRSMPDWGGER
jgi:sulfide:quinone oxidoreductase